MDNKRVVKEYIAEIVYWVQDEWRNKGNTSFKIWFANHQEQLAYIINDKGIDKRIDKQLRKRGFNSMVKYYKDEFYPLGVISIILM